MMKIMDNGATVYWEEGEFDDALNLMCVCGHKLSEHGCVPWWTEKVIWVSQCTFCTPWRTDNPCNQFRINNEA